MHWPHVYFLCILLAVILLFSGCLASLFFLEELKLSSYEIDILKTPVKADEEQYLPMIHIRSKYGQNYQCLLPFIEENESAEKKETANEKKKEDIDIKKLLKPLESACLLKTEGWWTYELCSGHTITQYHIEDGKILGPVITLGLYESDFDWTNETKKNNDKERDFLGSSNKFGHSTQRYHSQSYTNGSRCDLTGLPRSAEVRFFCEEDSGGDYIYGVHEPGICTYVFAVHTAKICSHPRLKPLPSNKAHTVSCSPLLNEKQYLQYLLKLEEEKSMAQNKRNKFLTHQEERLKVMKSSTKDGDGASDSFEKFKSLGEQIETSEELQNLGNIEKNDDYFEKMLWNEYDQEIEKLKILVPPERFSSVKDDIEKQIDSIINEAEEELDVNLDAESKTTAFTKLASTLNVLLEKLDKAEKDVTKATEQLEKIPQSVIITSKTNGKTKDHDQPESAVFDDDKLHIRIRRLDRKSPDSSGSELHEMDFAQRKQLEQAVKEKLEKSGLDTGRRIEVKIITAGYYDNEDGKDFHSLSDDETNLFKNMIMALLTDQQEAIQEMERHKKLEENYKFVWHNKEQSVTDDDE